jgi:hypothetical protein
LGKSELVPDMSLNTNRSKENFLFIVGAHKTATSTLVGMLNCHPDIFILYETELNQSLINRHGSRFLKQYPDARYLFRHSEDFHALYSQFQIFLEQKGYFYQYIGSKLPGLDHHFLEKLDEYRVIFNIRDIRTWLCKNTIVKKYETEYDVVPAAIDYCSVFLKSFRLPRVFHLRMEDLICNDQKVIAEMEIFLQINLQSHLKDWWEKIEIKDSKDPKASNQWWDTHGSSRVRPEKEDTQAEIASHPFWEELLPIFEKYYHSKEPISVSSIEKDLNLLSQLTRFSPLPLNKAYSSFQSAQFGENKKAKGLKRKIEKLFKR